MNVLRISKLNVVALALPSMFAAYACDAKEDFSALAGKRIGPAKLGMTKPQVIAVVGKCDRSYKLPTGEEVAVSEWKDPGKTTAINIIYDHQGLVTQISTNGPKVVTARGISINASLEDVKRKYKKLPRSSDQSSGSEVEYLDDVKNGICFEFLRDVKDGKVKEQLCAIAVHSPGKPVLIDAVTAAASGK